MAVNRDIKYLNLVVIVILIKNKTNPKPKVGGG